MAKHYKTSYRHGMHVAVYSKFGNAQQLKCAAACAADHVQGGWYVQNNKAHVTKSPIRVTLTAYFNKADPQNWQMAVLLPVCVTAQKLYAVTAHGSILNYKGVVYVPYAQMSFAVYAKNISSAALVNLKSMFIANCFEQLLRVPTMYATQQWAQIRAAQIANGVKLRRA